MKIAAFFLVITFTHTLVSMSENTEQYPKATELTSISLRGIVERNKHGFLLYSVSYEIPTNNYTGTVNNRGYSPENWHSASLDQQQAQKYYQKLLQALLTTQVDTSQQQK